MRRKKKKVIEEDIFSSQQDIITEDDLVYWIKTLGGLVITRQFNKGLDYIQSTYNVADGVTQIAPTLIFKGVVIDVDFKALKSTTYASLIPPFSVYAKIIGMDEDVADPEIQLNRIYYPPLFQHQEPWLPSLR